jgi:hypothetical protein
MPIKEAKCPACGAPIQFRAGSSLVVVCDYCHFAVARTDRDLEAIGKVAALADTESNLARGMTGHLGGHAFTVVGRLQLGYGQGTWDEWYAALDDERWCWIAEAQGKVYATFRAGEHPLPTYQALAPGHHLAIPGLAEFVVVERNEAKVLSAEGELPVRVKPGTPVFYADFEGQGGRFGTVDFGDNSTQPKPDLYLGHELTLEQLQLSGADAAPRPAARIRAQKLTCPKCNAPIEIQVPDQSVRVTCAHCNSLLDASQGALRYLGALAKIRATPKIPIGKHGTFRGTDFVCIGFQRRDCVVDGITYSWDEYLLYEQKKGFRWLVESNGHWTFVEPAQAGSVEITGSGVRYAGMDFKAYSEVTATTTCVLGEFYWEVQVGETAEATDYINPPHILSSEQTGKEIVWSRGDYVEPTDVWQAFRQPGSPPERTGVGANQPSPSAASARAVYRWCGLFFFALVLLFLAFEFTAKRQVVFDHSFDVPPGVNPLTIQNPEPPTPDPASGSPGAPSTSGVAPSAETAFFSEPFELNGHTTNMEAHLSASVSNNWVGANCALINDDSGEVEAFALEASYYFGYEDGESWSEGSRSSTEYLSRVRPGRYVVRVEPEWETGKTMPSFRLVLTWGEPRIFYFVLAALLLVSVPFLAWWRERAFESRRWADSTFSSGGSSSSDDDD